MRYRLFCFWLVLTGIFPGSGVLADHAVHGQRLQVAGCAQKVTPDCGSTVTPAFDPKGELWVAFSYGQHVWVARRGAGKEFLPAVKVNPDPEPLYDDGENRPKIAVAADGNIYVSWTQKTSEKFSGNIRFSRSVDNGRHFDAPRTINDDRLLTSHRFDAMHLSSSGLIYLVWLDKRDKVDAERHGIDYSGAAVYYAASRDKGATFLPNRKVADHSCECCRLAIDSGRHDEVVIFWRQLFARDQTTPIRDHAIATLAVDKVRQVTTRATWDNWAVNACPHHGPDISVDSNKITHLVWFTNSEKRKGIYYKRVPLSSFSAENPASDKQEVVMAVDTSATATHPQVISSGNRVVIAWKRFDGKKTDLLWISSLDGGVTWSKEAVIANSSQENDHPMLAVNGDRIHASWLARDHGYQLFELNF